MTVGEVRRSPYHNKIKNLPSDTKDLALADLKDLHSRNWNSRLTVFDFEKDGALPSAESASCKFFSEDQEYYTRKIEELRYRTFQSSVEIDARLIVVEDLTPPLLEILGSSFDLEPAVFQRHVASSWISRSNSISSNYSLRPGKGTWCITIPHPRLWEVYHPSAWRFAEWRNECLRRAATHLQCRQLMPVFDVHEENKVQCTAFEHYTLSFQKSVLPGQNKVKWRTTIFFPTSIKEWSSGNLYIKKHQNIGINISAFQSTDVRSDMRMEEPLVSEDPDVASWTTALKLLSDAGADLRDPIHILESLWCEALEHWITHQVHVARAVGLVTGSPGVDDDDLLPQQQLRAVIYQDVALISDILNLIEGTKERNLNIEFMDFQSTVEGGEHSYGPRLDDLRRQFSLVKVQLEQHLPALQHHIDIIRVKQQNRLAETQLEESRKAIQQADTIKRLTILAFIYIPIQTTASIFGMNLRELNPNPSIWVFALVATLLLLLTLSAAGWKHVWTYLSRIRYRLLGSFRSTIANALTALGLNVQYEPPSTLQAGARTTKPSWVV